MKKFSVSIKELDQLQNLKFQEETFKVMYQCHSTSFVITLIIFIQNTIYIIQNHMIYFYNHSNFSESLSQFFLIHVNIFCQ